MNALTRLIRPPCRLTGDRRPVTGLIGVFLLLTLAAAPVAAAEFALPEPQPIRLDNGMTVYLCEDHRLPVVSLHLLVAGAGSAFEPAGKDGLAELTGRLLLRGTREQDAESVAEELDFIGASLEVRVAEEFATLEGQCLAEHFHRMLAIAAGCATDPLLAPGEFQKERKRQEEDLQAAKDEPQTAVRMYFRRMYFGAHPLGRLTLGSEAGLNRLVPADVRAFYGNRYRPDRTSLAVVGDITRSRLAELLEAQFSRWPKPAAPPPSMDLPPLPAVRGRTVVLVDMPGATQAYFALGSPGFPFGDPVTAKADVLNTLFGGRFTSWLNNELRIQRGLTYGARSDFTSWRTGGLLTLSSYTQTARIGEMLDITLSLLRRGRTEEFSESAVASARSYILGQFPPTLESTADKAAAYAELAFYGAGFDYHARLLRQVRAVAPADLHETAQQLLPQDDYVLVVVGEAAAVRPQLEKLGTVQVKKLSDAGF